MSVPYLTKEDVVAILKDNNIVDIEPQVNGGQKDVIPIITVHHKYLAKYIHYRYGII